MANVTISPNMMLPVPVVSIDPGPDWATNLNACQSIIDGHDHSPGSGVQITPSGLDINAALNMQGNSLTNARSVNLFKNNVPIPWSTADQTSIYAAPNSGSGLYDLWYNDGNNHQIPITINGAVASGNGSIAGLPSGTASAAYLSGSGTFQFQQSSGVAANIDAGDIVLRDPNSPYNGVTLTAPTPVGSPYTIILPVPPTVTPKILVMDTSGNIFASIVTDNSTLQLTSNTLSVSTAGITATQLATNSVTDIKIAPAVITIDKLAPMTLTFDGSDPGLGGLSRSGTSGGSWSSGSTPLATTILTTGGNPVSLRLDGGAAAPDITIPPSVTVDFTWRRDGTVIARANYINNDSVNSIILIPGWFAAIDSGPGMDAPTVPNGGTGCPAGTHTYTFEVSQPCSWDNIILSAVEMR